MKRFLRRSFSTTAGLGAEATALPWPNARRPTPYQIFHFTPGSRPSPEEIKKRYYELVRSHHPDTSRLPEEQARARFQAIGDAYEALKNPRSARSWRHNHGRPLTPEELEELARRRAYHQAKRADMGSARPTGAPPPRPEPAISIWAMWGEGVVITAGTLLFLGFAFPYGILRHHTAAADLELTKSERARVALEEADAARREHGASRREEVRVMLQRIQARNDAATKLDGGEQELRPELSARRTAEDAGIPVASPGIRDDSRLGEDTR